MGFWTSGPVLGSLIVAVVGSATIPAVVHDPRFWTHEYRICGIAGLVVFLIALIGLRERVIYLSSMFGFSVKDANGLGNWNWGFLGIAYTPWMASYTETVEARNPALTATGLAIWGWIIRVVVFLAFLVIPVMINSVTPLVNYGSTVAAYSAKYSSELAFAQTHPAVVATAQTYKTQLANAVKFAPELAVIRANPALFAKLASYPKPAAIPPKLVARAVAAAGGGSKGAAILGSISANSAAISGVIAVAPKLATVAPYAAQLTALSKVPPSVLAFLKAHGAAVQKAAAQAPGQRKSWYWVCFGGIIVFLLSIPLLRGRWKPADARRDGEEHEAMVAAELAKLST